MRKNGYELSDCDCAVRRLFVLWSSCLFLRVDMILGLGVDLCSISRMQRAVRSPHFVRRLFRSSEIAYADGKENERARAASYASAFAAREAFAKASGVSMYTLAFSSEIRLERTDGGPLLIVPPEIDPAYSRGEKHVWISISHDEDCAVAVVLLAGSVLPRSDGPCGRVERGDDVPAIGALGSIGMENELRKLLPSRPSDMHKGDRGRILVAGGSKNYPGAPILTSLAALRSGGGIVSLLSLPEVCCACASRLPEVVHLPVPTEISWLATALAELPRTDVAVVGPGLGRSDAALRFAAALWEAWDRPLLMDGDALYALAVVAPPGSRANAVLTPHEGEAARLLSTTSAAIRRDRERAAKALAERWGCVLLKGEGTLIVSPDAKKAVRLNYGGPELSVPGSGDVLSGCIGVFLAQGLPPFEAAFLGGALHARAGQLLRERGGVDGILASEIADELPHVIRTLRETSEA